MNSTSKAGEFKIKKKICCIAFDDSPHKKQDLFNNKDYFSSEIYNKDNLSNKIIYNERLRQQKKVDLVGVVCKGNQLIHTSFSKISIDGLDSTQKIIQQVLKNPYYNEIKLIFIDSPTLAGFNVCNPFKIFEKTQIPVILLPDEAPKEKMVDVYRKIFPERPKQIQILKKLPNIESLIVSINENKEIKKMIYYHLIGVNNLDIIPVLHYLSKYSSTPEPLRIAHIIASRQNLSIIEEVNK